MRKGWWKLTIPIVEQHRNLRSVVINARF